MSDGPYKLTPWGRFVAVHGVLTHHTWWTKVLKEITTMQDRTGEDWGVMIDERIAGLKELKSRLIEEGEPKYWRYPEEQDAS